MTTRWISAPRRSVVSALVAVFVSGAGVTAARAQEGGEQGTASLGTTSSESVPRAELPGTPEFLAMPAAERSGLFKYRVSQVLSGHLVTIRVDNRFVIMRLLGLDTTLKESRAFLRDLLEDEEVCLEYDPDPRLHTDPHGHPMAYLFRAVDGLWINHAMIARGYSGLADVLGPRAEVLRETLRLARLSDQGLWSGGKLNLTWTPSLEQIQSINKTRWHRTRRRQGWRDWNEGVVDAFFEGRRQAAIQAGIESALRARASAGHFGEISKITIKNAASSQVRVHLSSENFSKDLVVAANGTRSFAIPFGQYEVSYHLEGDPDVGPHKGEPLAISHEPVEMEIKPRSLESNGPRVGQDKDRVPDLREEPAEK